MFIEKDTQDGVREYLLGKNGEAQKLRINRGVQQAAAFWRADDGGVEEFVKFCKLNFIADPVRLQTLFNRIETNFETLNGHLNKISLDLKRPLQLDWGEILPIDQRFGQFDPAAHVSDDMFDSKIAFEILLNFPAYTLAEKTELGPGWSRRDWAYARCGDLFLSRLPARASQNVATALSEAETYISEYNIYMGRLVDDQGKTLFPGDLKLISHWGLRDRLKALYADKHGLAGQEMIYEVLKRIIQQNIPQPMVNRDDFFWNPYQKQGVQGRQGDRLDSGAQLALPAPAEHLQGHGRHGRVLSLPAQPPAAEIRNGAGTAGNSGGKTPGRGVDLNGGQGRRRPGGKAPGPQAEALRHLVRRLQAPGQDPGSGAGPARGQKYPDLKAFDKDMRGHPAGAGLHAPGAPTSSPAASPSTRPAAPATPGAP